MASTPDLSSSLRSPAGAPSPVAAALSHVSVVLDDRVVLHDVTVSFEEGLVHGVLGRGGSGRSTLLKVIGGILPPESGAVSILGRDPAVLDMDALAGLRSGIGFQFQNLGLFDSLNVLDNVLFALTGGTPESAGEDERLAAQALLTSVGLGDSVGKAVAELSGGMQRRLAIARAFAPPGARLLIFDDPVGGLDPVTASRILELVGWRPDSSPGRTIVVSSHETAALSRICDRIHVIHDGTIVFSGTPAEAAACANPAVRELFGHDRRLEG